MKKIFLFVLAFSFMLSMFGFSSASAAELLIADFNSGQKPNNLGGDFGAWDKDPKDFTQSAFESFNAKEIHGEKGFSMRIDYDVDSPNPAYNGFWMDLKGKDFSNYSKLTFWIKGDKGKGCTKVMKLEFKNEIGEVGKFYVTGITEEWKKIEIPYNKFAGITDFSAMKELVIVLEDRIVTSKEGAFYLDDIYVVSE